MATFYLDFENGNDANAGTSFATRWKTITSGATAARTAPGDEIRIMKSPDPVSLGVNGTFTKGSPTITLSGAVTANIDLGTSAWTAGTNVSTATSSNRKVGTVSPQATINAGFTTGIIAYKATGALNLSTYQNASFWIRTSGNVAAGVMRLDLCSDTAGTTPVHSITIDTAFVSNIWKQVTWKNGAALSSSIQSVALYAVSTIASTTVILIDNIIACNDLHHGALIGTSSSPTGMVWYPIRSINGTTVVIESEQNNIEGTNTSRGWHDTTTTTLAYVRDTIPLTTQQTFQESGTAANRITYSGGWDRTSMSTQDGMTFVKTDRNNVAQAFMLTNIQYLDISRIGSLFGGSSFNTSGSSQYNRYTDIISNASASAPSFGTDSFIGNLYWISNNVPLTIGATVSDGVYVYSNSTSGVTSSGASCITKNVVTINNGTSGIIAVGPSYWYNVVSRDNGAYGFSYSTGAYAEIYGITTSGNTTAGIGGVTPTNMKAVNANLSDTTPLTTNGMYGIVSLSRYLNTIGGSFIFGAVRIADGASPVRPLTSRSYSFGIPSPYHSGSPLVQTLQPFPVSGGSLVTYKVWLQRTNTSVEGRIRLVGYVTPGVDADITATITVGANTWQELTITFTPSASGVAMIQFEAYTLDGNTGSVVFGDSTITQV